MADTETTTSPLSIGQLCHEWGVVDARLKLGGLEAGDDEDAVAAACKRNTERVFEIFEQIEVADAPSWDHIFALLYLAQRVIKEGEFSGVEPGERAVTLIGKALTGLRNLEHVAKGGGNG